MGEVFSEEPEPLPEVPERMEESVAAGVVGGAALAHSEEKVYLGSFSFVPVYHFLMSTIQVNHPPVL